MGEHPRPTERDSMTIRKLGNIVTRLRLVGLVMGCAALFGVGCGGASGGGAAAAVDVTGTWTGAATDASGGTHPTTLVVTQDVAAVTGDGMFDTKVITVTGTVSGKVWSGTFADGANKFATYKFTVEGDTATGTGIAASDGMSA